MDTREYYIASCSCGKDSEAMVLKLIEEGMPLNEIVFYDTGMEFSCIYRNWEYICELAKLKGIKCTTLKPSCPFLYKMFEKPVKNRDGSGYHNGYSWCGGTCRWGTTDKLVAIDKYAESKNAYVYVGIASDEYKRIDKERKEYKLMPLVQWEMKESDCLEYCRDRGVRWDENGIDLYDILDRVSCWCCRNKNHWELYNIWLYLPEYWERLKDMQSKLKEPMKKPYSVYDLEKRFENGYVPKHRKRKNEQ